MVRAWRKSTSLARLCGRPFSGAAAGLGALALDLLVERLSTSGRLGAKFLIECGDTTLILSQRTGSISQQVVQVHQAPVGMLAGSIAAQNSRSVGQTSLVLLIPLAVRHQLIQHR